MRLSLCRVTLFQTIMVSQHCAWCLMRQIEIFTGGMDLYVRQFGLQDHDDFYTNDMILTAFQNYTKEIVLRYLNSPAVFSWELANDAR
jgi:endo-1,4-beta-mannosidase